MEFPHFHLFLKVLSLRIRLSRSELQPKLDFFTVIRFRRQSDLAVRFLELLIEHFAFHLAGLFFEFGLFVDPIPRFYCSTVLDFSWVL